MDKKKHIISSIVVIAIVAIGAFYGGMQYGAKKAAGMQSAQGGRSGANFGGGAFGGQRGAQGAGQRAGGPAGGGAAGDFVSGQISAKDDTSVTVKMRDGSSKIVFFSSSTGIDKSVVGASSDLSVGQQVTVTGKGSPDGSLTAQSIQIRPTQPTPSAQ